MASIFEFWKASSIQRQFIVVLTGVILLSVVLASAWFWLKPVYSPAFTKLSAQDASIITAELDKQKIIYRLQDDGSTIAVVEDLVSATRLKIAGRELPLKGAIGFELFNSSDLGLTDFAQKINYLRALQGELARTISSVEDIASARVHLALGESGLFRRSGSKPKASVLIQTKSGSPVSPATAVGIQRLVASAVSDLDLKDVAVIDQGGSILNSKPSLVDDPKFDLKQDIEKYYVRKTTQQLESLLGQNNVSVLIDVDLNFDQVKVTEETNRKKSGTGSIGRAASTDIVDFETSGELPSRNSKPEEQFRHVEQMTSAPGTVRKIMANVLVFKPVDRMTEERLKAIVAAAIGFDKDRGDSVSVVHRDNQYIATATSGIEAAFNKPVEPRAAKRLDLDDLNKAHSLGSDSLRWQSLWVILGILIVTLGYFLFRYLPTTAKVLSIKERERKLVAFREMLINHEADGQIKK